MCDKYIYRYGQFVVKKTVEGGYVVVNLNASYSCHSHVKTIEAGKALCKLASKRKMPKSNDPYFVESLIRLSNNKKYLIELKRLKQRLDNSEVIYTPQKTTCNIKKMISDGIDEYFNYNID